MISKQSITRRIVTPLFLLSVLHTSGQAAPSSAQATIDPITIMIGEQTSIHLKVSHDKDKHYQLILPTDTLLQGIEIINTSNPDTITLENGIIEIKQDLILTSFDSGFYYIPPIRYASVNDTVLTEGLSLKVLSYDTDTITKPYDIKGVVKPNLVFSDLLQDWWWLVLIILLVIAGFYLYPYLKKWRSGESSVENIPLLPADIEAIQALEHLKERSLWQRGELKPYYTLLTDILRRYIERRYAIYAMEMTSDEILRAIVRDVKINEYKDLKQIFEIADLVKFAKWTPLSEDNETSLSRSYAFIRATKSVEEEVKPSESEKQETEKTSAEN